MAMMLRVLLVLGSLSLAMTAFAQPPAPIPIPENRDSGPQVGLGAPVQVAPTFETLPGPPPAAYVPVVPPLQQPVILIPAAPRPWVTPFYFDFELEFLSPVVQDHLHANVPQPDGSLHTVSPERTPLGWTVAPRFEAGYFLPDNQGTLSIDYRFYATDGTGSGQLSNGQNVNTRSRIDLNQFDFDYTTGHFELLPRLDSQVRVGARLASFFYDDRASNPQILLQPSNYFYGAGPHLEWDLNYKITLIPFLPGFSAFGKLDGAVLVGQNKQNFVDNETDASGLTTSTSFQQRHTQSVPSLMFQTGLAYTPPQAEYLHFSIGYQAERYWELGHINGANMDLTTQGVFLRGQIDF